MLLPSNKNGQNKTDSDAVFMCVILLIRFLPHTSTWIVIEDKSSLHNVSVLPPQPKSNGQLIGIYFKHPISHIGHISLIKSGLCPLGVAERRQLWLSVV